MSLWSQTNKIAKERNSNHLNENDQSGGCCPCHNKITLNVTPRVMSSPTSIPQQICGSEIESVKGDLGSDVEKQQSYADTQIVTNGNHRHTVSTPRVLSFATSPNKSISRSIPVEERIELLEENMEHLTHDNVRLRELVRRADQRYLDSQKSSDELYRRLGDLVTNMGTLSERIKLLETTTFAALQAQIDRQREDLDERDNDMAKLFANFKNELSNAIGASRKCSEDITTYQQQLLETQQSHERSIAEISHSVQQRKIQSDDTYSVRIENDVKKLVNETLEDFQRAQSTSLQEMAKKLEQEIDRRYRRLVESTQLAVNESTKGYETAAPQIRTLQNEMLQVREQLRLQALQVEAQRNDVSFENAINEMKDWVQDIERKLITRTEVEDAVLQLNSQLSALKHSSQSTESILAQKIEMEKNNRESAVSQLASQLLMSAKRK